MAFMWRTFWKLCKNQWNIMAGGLVIFFLHFLSPPSWQFTYWSWCWLEKPFNVKDFAKTNLIRITKTVRVLFSIHNPLWFAHSKPSVLRVKSENITCFTPVADSIWLLSRPCLLCPAFLGIMTLTWVLVGATVNHSCTVSPVIKATLYWTRAESISSLVPSYVQAVEPGEYCCCCCCYSHFPSDTRSRSRQTSVCWPTSSTTNEAKSDWSKQEYSPW